MSEQPKAKSSYYQNLDEHESLSFETTESGAIRLKFYVYKKAVNPLNFAQKLEMIEKNLNSVGYYIEGRPNKDPKAQKPDYAVSGEVADKSTSSKPLVTAKSDSLDAAVAKYKEKKKELDTNGTNQT